MVAAWQQPHAWLQGTIERRLVDSGSVYGPDLTEATYTVLLVGPFACKLQPRAEAVLGTGIGPTRVAYYHVLYPASVNLPAGTQWELEVAGERYTPQANTNRTYRDRFGSVVYRGVDVDDVGPAPVAP